MIDVRQCWAWLGLSMLPEPYLSGGPPWLASRIKAMHGLGAAGVTLHCPLGFQGVYVDGVPQYGLCQAAWMRAQSPRHAVIVDGMAQALAPLVRAGIQILPYLGSPDLSPELDRAHTTAHRMDLLADNLRPFENAGIKTFAIDSSVLNGPGTKHGAIIDYWRANGLTIYIESTPHSGQWWAVHDPIYVDERLYQSRKALPEYARVQLTGPVMRFVPAPNGAGLTGPEWGVLWAEQSAPMVRAILADGHIPVVEALDDAVKWCGDQFQQAPPTQ